MEVMEVIRRLYGGYGGYYESKNPVIYGSYLYLLWAKY